MRKWIDDGALGDMPIKRSRRKMIWPKKAWSEGRKVSGSYYYKEEKEVFKKEEVVGITACHGGVK